MGSPAHLFFLAADACHQCKGTTKQRGFCRENFKAMLNTKLTSSQPDERNLDVIRPGAGPKLSQPFVLWLVHLGKDNRESLISAVQ